ncbi:MAG: hypothetical protein E7644_04325 [Ruminococcaceae bacterium]|nr:hypothetical protein [Oscillospiraceae bacterium]
MGGANMNFLHTKKFRHGSVSLALVVVIIAAVILLNAIFSTIVEKNQWYLDMTPEPVFTLSEKAKSLLTQVDESHEVTITFCDAKDAWMASAAQMEVLKTALDIEADFDNVKVEFIDIFINPSAVNDYKVRTGKDISPSTVIIKSGTEVRVHSLDEFFMLDSSSTSPTVKGYDGEYRFVSSILAVTRAEAPVLCVTNNHGEELPDPSLLNLMEGLGFEVQTIDLSKDEIPEDCRLILVFDPQTDFLEKQDGISDVSEIDKLEKFLYNSNSLLVFFDPETPVLPNLEQLLAEWGISISRQDDDNYMIQDLNNSLTTNGFTIKGNYETEGTGADITAQLREDRYPKPVVFPNATALEFSSLYTVRQDSGYKYGYYSTSGANTYRCCYKVFTSYEGAVANAAGEEIKTSTAEDPFSYMLLGCQTRGNADGTRTNSYVLAVSSTSFVTEGAMSTSYGNNAVLSYACNTMGTLVVPVDIDCKYYANSEIATITSKAANQFTVILTVVPTAIVFIAGIYVMVRRKYA